MKIPFHRPAVGKEEAEAVTACIMNGWLTMGEETFEFEKEFCRHTGAAHSVAVNSCTAALHLAFRCIELSPGDEVILPVNSFISSDEVVRYFGAQPVLADVDPETHSLDPASFEAAVSSKTRAVVPVHFSGQAAEMDEIGEIADSHKIAVIDDAAHAFPASYRGRSVGTLGDLSVFSFYATKTLSTGEGGMVTTEYTAWAERMKKLRLHGIDGDAWKRYRSGGRWSYDVAETGYKYNTTDLNAAMGRVQLQKSSLLTEKRTAIAESYNRAFGDCEELIPYRVKDDRISSWHLYALKLNIESLSINRDEFVNRLAEKGVGTSVHFIPLYRFSLYKDYARSEKDFPAGEWVFERTVSLPIFPQMTEEEVAYVIETVLDTVRKNRR